MNNTRKVVWVNHEEEKTLTTSVDIKKTSEVVEFHVPLANDDKCFLLNIVGDEEKSDHPGDKLQQAQVNENIKSTLTGKSVDTARTPVDETAAAAPTKKNTSPEELTGDKKKTSKNTVDDGRTTADGNVNGQQGDTTIDEDAKEKAQAEKEERDNKDPDVLMRLSDFNGREPHFRLVGGMIISTGKNESIPEGFTVPAAEIFWDDEYRKDIQPQLVVVELNYESRTVKLRASYSEFTKLYNQLLKNGATGEDYVYAGIDPKSEAYFSVKLTSDFTSIVIKYDRLDVINDAGLIGDFTKNIEFGLTILD